MPQTPTQKVETLFDSCFRVIYRQRNGTIVTRKKRRPKGLGIGECSWIVPCPDHAAICGKCGDFVRDHPNDECNWFPKGWTP